jgi:hypothetical protein
MIYEKLQWSPVCRAAGHRFAHDGRVGVVVPGCPACKKEETPEEAGPARL